MKVNIDDVIAHKPIYMRHFKEEPVLLEDYQVYGLRDPMDEHRMQLIVKATDPSRRKKNGEPFGYSSLLDKCPKDFIREHFGDIPIIDKGVRRKSKAYRSKSMGTLHHTGRRAREVERDTM